MATYRSEPPVPADIITYRLDVKLVYVRPADDYQQALDYAQKEFPDELASIPRDHISFHIDAKMNGVTLSVRISESAWVATVARLLRGEIINIVVRQPLCLDTKEMPPPRYRQVSQSSRHHNSSALSSHRMKGLSPSPPEKGSSWFGRH